MATISGLTLSDAMWYGVNWNQMRANILMNGLSNDGGGEGFTLDTFKYTNAHEDATTQPYVDVSVSNFQSRFGGVASRNFHFILNNLQVPNNAVETVLFLIGTMFSTSNVLTIDDRYGLGFSYLWGAPTAHFQVMYRTDDGTIHEYAYRDGVENTNNYPVLNYIPGEQNNLTYGLGEGNDPTQYVPKSSNGYSWAIAGEPTKSITTSFKCSHKAFMTRDDAYNYLKFGIDKSLNEEGEESGGDEDEHPLDTKTYTYDVQKFSYSDVALSRPNGNVVHSVLNVTFTDFPTDVYDSITHYEPIVAVLDNDDYDSSVQFVIHSDFAQYITDCSIKIGNISVPVTNPSTAITGLTSFGYGMGFDTTGSAYIKNMVHTNITIIGVGGGALPQSNILGGDVMITNTNNANFDVGLSECWVLSEHNMKKLAKCFNTTVNKLADNSGGYIVADWLLGLSSYNNPLDVVSDLFYLPVDISDYTDTDDGHFNFTPSLDALNEEE